MKNIIKQIDIKAVLCGFFVVLLLDMVAGGALGLRYILVHGESITQFPQDPLTLWLSLIIGSLTAVVGGFVTARMAKAFQKFNVVLLGIIGLLAGLLFFEPEIPILYNIIGFAAVLPCTYLGGAMGLKFGARDKKLPKAISVVLVVLAVLLVLTSCGYAGVSFYTIGLKTQAERGDAKAQYELGWRSQNGDVLVQQNYNEAAKWYSKAAEQGHAEGQRALGNLYYMGLGVNQDYAEALNWTEKAAKQGNARAQFALGHLYAKGQGVQQNYAEAAKWYRASSEQGERGAQFEFAVLYYNGLGVEKNYEEAAHWWYKSAVGGNEAASRSLGYLYAKGQGVTQSDEAAYFWLLAAPVSGNSEYTTTFNDVASRLSSEQKLSVEKSVQGLKTTRVPAGGTVK